MNQTSDYNHDEIDLSELFKVLWINKTFIALFTAVFAFLAIIYSLMLNNIYTAKTVFVPTALNQSADKLSGLSAFANIGGFSLPDSDPNVSTALGYIESKDLVKRLMQYESFLPDLMAATSWNLKANSLFYDSDVYDINAKKWVREIDPPFGITPSVQEAYKVFTKLISVSQDKKNQLVTLSVEHISPVVAQQWSIWIAQEVNKFVANLRVNEAMASIEYLEEQVISTPYAELRSQFYELIQQKTQSMMLANVNPEFVLTTIDPPLVAEIKSKPKRALICILGTLLGGMLSVLIIFIRKYGFNKEDELNIFRLR